MIKSVFVKNLNIYLKRIPSTNFVKVRNERGHCYKKVEYMSKQTVSVRQISVNLFVAKVARDGDTEKLR